MFNENELEDLDVVNADEVLGGANLAPPAEGLSAPDGLSVAEVRTPHIDSYRVDGAVGSAEGAVENGRSTASEVANTIKHGPERP